MSNFLPIETAPRDGTIIVAHFDHHPPRPAMFDGEAWVVWGCITESAPEPRGWHALTTQAGTAGEAEELARCKSSRERWIAMSCEFEHRLETLRSSLWSIVEHWKRRADESEYGPAYASCADEIKAELIDDAATPPSASSSAAAGAVSEATMHTLRKTAALPDNAGWIAAVTPQDARAILAAIEAKPCVKCGWMEGDGDE